MNSNYIKIESENHEIIENENEGFIDELNVDYNHLENENFDCVDDIDSRGNKIYSEESQIENNTDSKNNSKEPIYVMTLELDQNNSANLKIYTDSVPYELAYEFCKNNNLDYTSLNYLASEIENLMTTYNTKMNQESKLASDLEDEIIELDEEQLSTEKNRNTEDKDKLNFLSSNRKFKESISIENELDENINNEEENEERFSEGLDSSNCDDSRKIKFDVDLNNSTKIKTENQIEDIAENCEIKNPKNNLNKDLDGTVETTTNILLENKNENLFQIQNKNEKSSNLVIPSNTFNLKNSPPISLRLNTHNQKTNSEISPSIEKIVTNSDETKNKLRNSEMSQAKMKTKF